MAAYQFFEELPIWQEARELVRLIYKLTKQEEFSKDFGLKDQIQRAGVSIMTNIAEGFERRTTKEFQQFLNYSKASSGEVRSLSYVSLDQAYVTEEQFNSIREFTLQLSRSITGFDRYLGQSNH
ncbi:four helix bundle protein [Pelagicoccus sp. NFK12]|uniref:Four helix bundle protein n=1 Tax=Pelagicoccus enzymogenes TaxID=2773457 RepID=A0A927FA24_9BACT|nr:four helix bundle protein [Pelagicoccus enzymogenes]MBD5781089.1 four helix bundle protein [Pelagicoccus enzymogenes]